MVTAPPKPQSYVGALLIIGALFFVFGFVTWVNSVLIAFFKQAFDLNTLQANLVTSAFYISYTVMAIPSSWVLGKTGFKNGMSLGLLTMAVGTLIFVPAANAGSYPMFLAGLFLIGIGLTVLQTASNPYATILGPRESAAQRISFLGVANKGAGIISQFVFGGLFLTGSNAVVGIASLQKVVTPYLILTGVLVILAGLIRFSTLPEVSEEENDAVSESVTKHTSIWQFPNLVLGVLALFCYVGAEVISGETIINYGKTIKVGDEMYKALTPFFSVLKPVFTLLTGKGADLSPLNLPNYLTVFTLIGLLTGYVLGIVAIPRWISQQKALRYGMILALVFTTGALVFSGFASVLCVALLGFAIAPAWPAIWPLALNRLGKFTKLGSALLIMAIAGGAVLTPLHGYLTDAVSPKLAYGLLLPLFAYILYYATEGYKKTEW